MPLRFKLTQDQVFPFDGGDDTLSAHGTVVPSAGAVGYTFLMAFEWPFSWGCSTCLAGPFRVVGSIIVFEKALFLLIPELHCTEIAGSGPDGTEEGVACFAVSGRQVSWATLAVFLLIPFCLLI